MAKTTTMKKKITNPTTAKKENIETGAGKTTVKEVVAKNLSVDAEEKKITAEAKPKKALKAKKIPEKITTAEEPKKITTAKAPEKITAAKEPKKLTAAKAPEKIAAKPEPIKIAEKVDAKAEEKPAAKAPAKVKAAKKAIVKAAPKVEKTAVKKVVEEKAAKKKEPSDTDMDDKTVVYNGYSLEECIAKMHALGVVYSYEDYANILLDEADMKQIEKNIMDGNDLHKKTFAFAKDGYDLDLIRITLEKVADTMDIKAKDFADIKKAMNTCVQMKLSSDDEKNASEYLNEFKLCEKLLMIGQRKHIVDSSIISDLIGSDVDAFVKHFYDFAYEILPSWKYDDMRFYEDFAYAVLSQYSDLYNKYQLRILIDVADLYIKHGDFQHGDEAYGYILRDNQIKDYIYYRYAAIYENIDFNKAKEIAYASLKYVDDRYMYYPNIMEIINK